MFCYLTLKTSAQTITLPKISLIYRTRAQMQSLPSIAFIIEAYGLNVGTGRRPQIPYQNASPFQYPASKLCVRCPRKIDE